MTAVRMINMILGTMLLVFYSYQIFYIFVPFFKRDKPHKETKLHRYAVLISARNEENVIANLVNSIHHQDYPRELVDIYVIADNCTDSTAERAREAGANVFVRENLELIGKGYALDYAITRIFNEKGEDFYDGFFVFDADNILDTGYITEMNRTFSDGYRIITSYRNSTNYGTNWVTSGYALWYIRESQYVNHSRMLLGSGCAVNGTGFLVSSEVLKESDGWKYHLLTEDIEFSIAKAIDGERIAFCPDALLYDEQPQTFKQSVKQRLRWARGFLQVFYHYGFKLVKKLFSKNFWTCYDMLMTIMPVNVIMLVLGITSAISFSYEIANGAMAWWEPLWSLGQWCGRMYAMFFIMGLVAVITESKRIHTSTTNRMKYLFTFPLFQFTYMPVSVLAIFKRVRWEPTRHEGPPVSTEKIENTKEHVE